MPLLKLLFSCRYIMIYYINKGCVHFDDMLHYFCHITATQVAYTVSLKLKGKVYAACVRSCLMYSSETLAYEIRASSVVELH